MESHSGEHPRIGAVDVVPFVPLAGTTMSDCVDLARAFGPAVADRFGIPVYLYGEAATSGPPRQRLADVRRGQFEGLKTQIGEPGAGARLRARPRSTPAPVRWPSAPGRS